MDFRLDTFKSCFKADGKLEKFVLDRKEVKISFSCIQSSRKTRKQCDDSLVLDFKPALIELLNEPKI